MTKLKLLIVDDHALFEDALRRLLESQADLTVVGGAAHGSKAVKLAAELRPDLILMDLQLADLDGLKASQEILLGQPGARILLVTGSLSGDQLSSGIQIGIAGFVMKTETSTELLRAIRAVAGGHAYLSPEVSDVLMERLRSAPRQASRGSELTAREREVLKLTAEGLRVKEIANQLSIGPRTVETHRAHLMQKLHCASTSELTRYAIRQGIASV